MKKISITIDLGKIDKNRIIERTYTNKEGQEVIVKEYKLDVVPLRNKKEIKSGDTWKLVKSHFVADSQTKEEREAKADTNFLGDGVTFEDVDPLEDAQSENVQTTHDDIPF